MHLGKLAILALAGVSGCSGEAPGASVDNTSPPPADGKAVAAIETNLGRLRDLDVFEVGDLIVNASPQTPDAVAAAKATAAERLADFADQAEHAVLAPSTAYACLDRVDANLTALQALEIVDVGAFIRSEPKNNFLCYNLPCPEDVSIAAHDNEVRAAKLESIALEVSRP